MEVVVENLVDEATLGGIVVEVVFCVKAALPVGLVVNEPLLTGLMLCVLIVGILRKTRAGGNWLIGGMIAGLSEELVAVDQRRDGVAVSRFHSLCGSR